MTYTSMDKKTVNQQIMSEVQELVKTYAEAHGLELAEGTRGKYSDIDVTLNGLTLKIAGSTSFKEQQQKADLVLALTAYNLTSKPVNGKQIIRYDSRKPKYPIIYKDLRDGNTYKTSIEQALIQFAA